MDFNNKLQQNHHQKHKGIFTQGNKSINEQQVEQNDKKLTLNTDILDNAMQELIDICQLHSNKMTLYDKDNNKSMNNSIVSNKEASNNLLSNKLIQNRPSNKQMTSKSDNNSDVEHVLDKKNSDNLNNNCSNPDTIIEKLQKKQSELQLQLDEALKVSKRLELKQKHRLNCIFEDEDNEDNLKSKVEDLQADEEDDLIEFQKIENDLRLSDINRQLDDIQEELRIRLYKRLLSNTNSNYKKQQNVRQTIRRGSQTDESSPTSSSCSDEQPTTSSPSIFNDNIESKACHDISDGKQNRSQNNEFDTSNLNNNKVVQKTSESFERNQNTSNNQLSQNFTPTSSSSGYSSIRSDESLEKGSLYAETNNIYMDISDNNSTTTVQPNPSNNISNSNNTSANCNNTPAFYTSVLHPNKNTSSINSDLERIEEDEEDGQDYYSNSEHFRTIYEEKFSPIIHANDYSNEIYKNPRSYHQPLVGSQTSWLYSTNTVENNHYNELNELNSPSQNASSNNFIQYRPIVRQNLSKNHINSNNNRPLTLYLPKPDENIDLIEHVQALGHDLRIISNELKLDTTTAQGYLWKSCSNNNKRWLKRYFYFDRTSKLLSYYDNEGQLVNKKKQQTPNNCIPFDGISDVYVDHKLSVLSGKNDKSSSKKKNYVFVLVTTGRKYLLSSRRAEIMRAWIDILFTAAKANDYFHQLTETNNCNEVEFDNDDEDNLGDLNSAALEVA